MQYKVFEGYIQAVVDQFKEEWSADQSRKPVGSLIFNIHLQGTEEPLTIFADTEKLKFLLCPDGTFAWFAINRAGLPVVIMSSRIDAISLNSQVTE